MKISELFEASMDNPRNPDLPDHFEIKHDGQVVHVNISPFSWMYPDRPEMGFSLSLEKSPANIGREFVEVDKAYNDMKKADVVKLANEWLKKNGIEKLEKAKAAWADHRKEGEKLTKKLDAKDASDDAKAKKNGMKFKVKAVVEPKAGSDYTIMWYAETKPTPADVKKVLRSKGSDTFDNYKITAL